VLTPNELLALKCQKNFHFFVKTFWPEIISDTYHDSAHIKPLCDKLQGIAEKVFKGLPRESDLAMSIAPSTSKSTILMILFPAWIWCRDATMRIMTGSYNASLANDQANKSRIVINSPLYKQLFPHIILRQDADSKQNYQNTLLGDRRTASPGTGLGAHANFVLIDDPLDALQAYSAIEREKAFNWVASTMSSRRTQMNVSVMIVCGQRLHVADPIGMMLARSERLDYLCLPAELTKDATWPEIYKDNLLDPVRLTREVLDEQKKMKGTSGYNAQYLQNPSNAGSSIISESWVKIMPYSQFSSLYKDEPIHFRADTSYGVDGGDYSAIVGGCVIDKTLYVTCAGHVNAPITKLLQWAKNFVYTNGYTNQSQIKVEGLASGKSLVQFAHLDKELNITEWDNMKGDKHTKLRSVMPMIETPGKVVFVEGKWNSELIGQLCTDSPPFDDQRDCLVQLINDLVTLHSNGSSYANIRIDGNRIGDGKINIARNSKIANYGNLSAWQKYDRGIF
jgi:phage terminase large subunit-like protein